ncbi:hypothetical protein SLE2022_406100 [Rubroshorea leprosula]
MSTGHWKRPYNPHEPFHQPGTTQRRPVIINGYTWVPGSSDVRRSTRSTVRQNERTDTEDSQPPAINDRERSPATSPPEEAHFEPSPSYYEDDDHDYLDWYFATPRLAYEPECMRESEEKFVNYGYRLQLPELTLDSRFGTLEKYLCMYDMKWFSEFNSTMCHYSKYFKDPDNLGQCAVKGPATGQV